MPNEPELTPVESTPSRVAVVLDTSEELEALAEMIEDGEGEE
jgi:hypothetical protein